MNIAILGCNGFVGSNLARYFNSIGWVVYGMGTSDYAPSFINYYKTNHSSDGIGSFFREAVFGACINAAGSGNVGFSFQNPTADFASNVNATIRILDALRIHQPKCHYIHLSSAAVYGNPLVLPIKEEQPLRPLSPYGFHKLMSESICKEYSDMFNLKISILRPFSIYGSYLQKQLLWDICRKMEESDNVTLFGTGKESRDFIHVQDIASLIEQLIKAKPKKLLILNAATGIETEIREIASLCLPHFKGKTISFSGKERKGDPNNWRADISKSKQLGFQPQIDIKKGIPLFIKWFKSLS